MIYFFLILSIWMIADGIIYPKTKMVHLKSVRVFKGTLTDMQKKRNNAGFLNYYPIVTYFDKKKQEFNQIVLKKESADPLFPEIMFRSTKTYISNNEIKVWITVKENGEAQYLTSFILEFLLPAGLLILGLIFMLLGLGYYDPK